MIDIDLIAGARPNFMKIAPIIHAIQNWNQLNDVKIKFRLIHTGQHYDKNMSGVFFEELNIPEPDINLNAGSGTQAEQTAQIMLGYESLLMSEKAKLCLVVGDVTSTLACSIVAKKQHLKLAHVESGLRSNDRTMPEEINRLVTDSISDLFFTTTNQASDILLKEGVSSESIFLVGNTMIDTLIANLPKLRKPNDLEHIQLPTNNYILVTLHRPSNVDIPEKLVSILDVIAANTENLPLVFPIHPRTQKVLDSVGYNNNRFIYTKPLPYQEFMFLVKHCKAVITDSGGVTEETTFLGKPCLTLRNSTERPETVLIGTNILVGDDPQALIKPLFELMNNRWKKGAIPEMWDGNAAKRIVEVIARYISK
jgi:UDP-N-acetylglucosamine 2-epimerase (non-hydrolysing)